jgi:hypothetical protein
VKRAAGNESQAIKAHKEVREEGHPPCASSSGRWSQQSSIRFLRSVNENPNWLISKQIDAGCQGLCGRDHFINTSTQM